MSKRLSQYPPLFKQNLCKEQERDSWIGETMRVPSPSPVHQLIVQRILIQLQKKIGRNYILLQAPCDLQLSETEYRQPDLMLIHHNQAGIIHAHAVVKPPDVVIEVLSKTSGPLDCQVKRQNYAKFGIPEYWIVDGESKTIAQFTLPQAGSIYNEAKVFYEHDMMSSRLGDTLFKVKDIFTIYS